MKEGYLLNLLGRMDHEEKAKVLSTYITVGLALSQNKYLKAREEMLRVRNSESPRSLVQRYFDEILDGDEETLRRRVDAYMTWVKV